MIRARRTVAALALAGAAACNLSPLNNRLRVGEESFVAFLGEGIDGNTDIFVSPAGGGTVLQLTFTPLVERFPALAPHGDAIAFVRARDTLPATKQDLVVMNLLNGADRSVPLPADAGRITAIGWARDGAALYARTDRQGATATWRVAMPPTEAVAVAVTGDALAAADSAFAAWIGDPPFARLLPCASRGVCVIGASGDTTVLAAEGREPFSWGADSIAWFEGDALLVRGAGPGSARRLTWTRPPQHPRAGSYAEKVVPPPATP